MVSILCFLHLLELCLETYEKGHTAGAEHKVSKGRDFPTHQVLYRELFENLLEGTISGLHSIQDIFYKG